MFLAFDDGGKRVCEPYMRVNGVHLAGFDHRGDGRLVFRASIVACKEGVPSVQGNGTNGALDGVVVDFDATARHEAAKAIMVFDDVGECLTEGRFGRSAGAVAAKSVIISGKDRR
jgi:hypothetical protein